MGGPAAERDAAGADAAGGEAETLTGRRVSRPGAFGGRPAVVVWSFSREAGEGVKAWMAGLEKEGVQAWGAAMLDSAPRLIRPLIRSGMREQAGGQAERWRRLCRGEKEWRAALGVTDDRAPVAVVVDGQGRMAWRRAGRFDGGAAAVRQQMKELK